MSYRGLGRDLDEDRRSKAAAVWKRFLRMLEQVVAKTRPFRLQCSQVCDSRVARVGCAPFLWRVIAISWQRQVLVHRKGIDDSTSGISLSNWPIAHPFVLVSRSTSIALLCPLGAVSQLSSFSVFLFVVASFSRPRTKRLSRGKPTRNYPILRLDVAHGVIGRHSIEEIAFPRQSGISCLYRPFPTTKTRDRSHRSQPSSHHQEIRATGTGDGSRKLSVNAFATTIWVASAVLASRFKDVTTFASVPHTVALPTHKHNHLQWTQQIGGV